MKLNKKYVLIASLAIVLCVALYLNLQFGGFGNMASFTSTNKEDGQIGQAQFVSDEKEDAAGEPEGEVTETSAEDYFASAKLDRQQAKDEVIETFNTIIENPNSSEQEVESANANIASVAERREKESNIETLVKAKGFNQCVAVVSDEAVNVIVQAEQLDAAQTIQIKDIVVNECGIDPNQIKIVEVK